MEKYKLQMRQEQTWEVEVEAASPEEAKRRVEQGLREGAYYPKENGGEYGDVEVELSEED